MLKVIRHCEHCGAEMESIRSTKTFCSEACRKRAARGIDLERQAESRWIMECLRRMGLLAKIWPTYSWDKSPPVFALLVPTQTVLAELNLYGSAVTEAELEHALRDCDIETSGAGEGLKAAIKAFYDGRKDRRLREGYTPSDEARSAS